MSDTNAGEPGGGGGLVAELQPLVKYCPGYISIKWYPAIEIIEKCEDRWQSDRARMTADLAKMEIEMGRRCAQMQEEINQAHIARRESERYRDAYDDVCGERAEAEADRAALEKRIEELETALVELQQVHDVGKAFNDLAVKERNQAWQREELLKADRAALEKQVALLETCYAQARADRETLFVEIDGYQADRARWQAMEKQLHALADELDDCCPDYDYEVKSGNDADRAAAKHIKAILAESKLS